MEENLDERRGIRDYLLGILEDPEMKGQIEKKLLAGDDQIDREIETSEDELIEEYLDDELSPPEREHFINQFLAAPERRQHLRINQNLRKYAAAQEPAVAIPEEPAPWWRFFSMRVSYALVFVVVLVIGYGVWLKKTPPDVETAVAELRLAYKGDRPFDSRIVGFDYAPSVTQRSGNDPGKDPNKDLKKRAEMMLEKAVTDGRTAESLHGRGEAYLAKGELQDAIRCFDAAAALGPVSAGLMSDLGAAYLEAWKKDRASAKPEMLDKSLSSLERAIKLDPRLPEPRFNSALVLEEKGLREQAKQAWREYLELDPNSKWADEARRNLQNLEEQ